MPSLHSDSEVKVANGKFKGAVTKRVQQLAEIPELGQVRVQKLQFMSSYLQEVKFLHPHLSSPIDAAQCRI
jgi:hypothetical protein